MRPLAPVAGVPRILALALCAAGGACADPEPSTGQEGTSGATTGTGAGTGTTVGTATTGGSGTETGAGTDTASGSPRDAILQDRCADARTVGAGRWYGTLADHRSSEGGSCGLGGPDAFVGLEVPIRADLRVFAQADVWIPRVGVYAGPCGNDWAHRGLACTRGLPQWIQDLPAGTELHVVVGTDPDDPVLERARQEEDASNLLTFALDLAFRPVLAEGEGCAGTGRCEAGTVCTSGESPGSETCVAVEGDTCGRAVDVELGPGSTFVLVDPARPYADHHAHGCVGARRPEKVFRLRWAPGATGSAQRLTVTADAADVGLALRTPECAVEQEVACATGQDGPARLEAGLGSAGVAYLFVELRADVEDTPVVELRIDLEAT